VRPSSAGVILCGNSKVFTQGFSGWSGRWGVRFLTLKNEVGLDAAGGSIGRPVMCARSGDGVHVEAFRWWLMMSAGPPTLGPFSLMFIQLLLSKYLGQLGRVLTWSHFSALCRFILQLI
jgi:hypothetical protein